MGQWKWQHSKQPVKVGAFISLFAKMKFWASQYPTVLEILVLKFMIIICKWHFQGYSHWARRYSGALGPLGRGHCMALRSAKFSVLLYHIPHIFLLSYCFPIHPISHCRGDGKWDGYRCPNKFPYLCEKGNTDSHQVQSTFSVLIQTKNLIIMSHQLLRWRPHHCQKQQQKSRQYLLHLRVLPSHFQLPLGWDFLYHDLF